MTKTRAALSLASILALAACGTPAEETILTDDDVQAILSLDHDFQEAVRAKNFEALRSIFAADAVSLPPGAEAIHGIDAIIAYHTEQNADISLNVFDTDSEVVDGDDTVGYQYGTWSAVTTGTDGSEATTRGKFMWILRRGESGWMVVADIWNATPAS